MSTLPEASKIIRTQVATTLPVAELVVSPWRPNAPAEGELFAELLASIRAQGVLVPLLVRQNAAGVWEVVSGVRRLAAARVAGLPRVPIVVRRGLDDEPSCLVAWLVDNLQRVVLDPMEEARAYQRLRELGWKLRQIEAQVGVSKGQISRRLSLLKLPADVQELVSSGAVGPTHAREVARVETPEAQRELAGAVAQGAVTHRQLEQVHRPVSGPEALPRLVERGLNQVLADCAARLPVQLLHVGIRLEPQALSVQLVGERRKRAVRSLTCSLAGTDRAPVWKVHLESGEQVEWERAESWEVKR